MLFILSCKVFCMILNYTFFCDEDLTFWQAGFGPLLVLQQEQVIVTREASTQQFEHHNP